MVTARDGEEKLCVDSGLRLHGTGDFESASDEEMLSAANAALKVYQNHLRKLRPISHQSRSGQAPLVKKKIYKEIMRVQQDVEKIDLIVR